MLPLLTSLAAIAVLFACAVLGCVSQVTAVQEEPLASNPSAQAEIRRWVNVAAVNFRRGPGVNRSVIRVLTANERVRVLETVGGWVRVEWDIRKRCTDSGVGLWQVPVSKPVDTEGA